MSAAILTGWQPGLKKISLTQLIRAYTGYDLAQGKHCVDDLLEGKTVVLPELRKEQADIFVTEARKLGAICEIGSRAAHAA